MCAREWNIRSNLNGGETRALKCDSYNCTHAYSVQDRCEQISQRIPPLFLHTLLLTLSFSLVANRIILIIIIFLFNRIFFLLMRSVRFEPLFINQFHQRWQVFAVFIYSSFGFILSHTKRRKVETKTQIPKRSNVFIRTQQYQKSD